MLSLRYNRSLWAYYKNSRAEQKNAETDERRNESLMLQTRNHPGASGVYYIEEDPEYEGWIYVEHGKYAGMYITDNQIFKQ